LDKIRYWYNGYTWDGKTAIYNPLSTMKFFQFQDFDNYWFNTGTPTFLIDLIQRRNRVDVTLNPIVVSSNIFKGYDPANIGEVSLLFQTGYLTIKKIEPVDIRTQYTLGVPNMEVSESLLTYLVQAYGKYPDEQIDELRETMKRHITDCDESGFAGSLETMIATVPSELHIPSEHYYHSLMLIWMRLIGFKIRAEEHNNPGRSDLVWEQPGLTVVAEIKYHAETKIDTLLNEAMKQIHDRRYYGKYLGKILILGIAFSGRQPGCRMEILSPE
jgi:hypothetical protein